MNPASQNLGEMGYLMMISFANVFYKNQDVDERGFMPRRKYTDLVDLLCYHLSKEMSDELNYMYGRYHQLSTVEQKDEIGIMPIQSAYFAEIQEEWSKYLPDICILWKYDSGHYIGYFYQGLCEGKLIIVDPDHYTVVGVFQDYHSFTYGFWSPTLSRYPHSLRGDFPNDWTDPKLHADVLSVISGLYSLLEKAEHALSKRLLIGLITKLTPQSHLEQLKVLMDFPDPYIQMSLFKTLRYFKYPEATAWLKALLAKDNLSEEVRREAEWSFDIISYPATLQEPVIAQGEYKKYSNRTQYGDVIIRYEPIEGEPLRFTVEEEQRDVPSSFYMAIESGFFEAVHSYKKYRLVGIQAVLIGGSTQHESTETAYKIASFLAFQNALEHANIVLIKDK